MRLMPDTEEKDTNVFSQDNQFDANVFKMFAHDIEAGRSVSASLRS